MKTENKRLFIWGAIGALAGAIFSLASHKKTEPVKKKIVKTSLFTAGGLTLGILLHKIFK